MREETSSSLEVLSQQCVFHFVNLYSICIWKEEFHCRQLKPWSYNSTSVFPTSAPGKCTANSHQIFGRHLGSKEICNLRVGMVIHRGREDWLYVRVRSQSQTKISLTSSSFTEGSRCKFGECHFWAVNSWKKYLNPVCVAILCPQFPHNSICRFTRLQQLNFAFLSWGLGMQSWGHLPVLNRFEGRVSLTEPRSFCLCWIYSWDWESCGLKKKNQFYPYVSGIKQRWQTGPWIWQSQPNFILFHSMLFWNKFNVKKRSRTNIFSI